MSNYRRYFVPGGTYIFTLVTYQRRPRFANAANITCLRESIAIVQKEMPFEFLAAVILPDHLHFLWTLPAGDTDYSKRLGRIKALFTKSLSHERISDSPSRQKHREGEVWQRRFWEHSIDDDRELETFADYIHYNPVKHGLASCPHVWPASSFSRWVALGQYESCWGCSCDGRRRKKMTFDAIQDAVGEP